MAAGQGFKTFATGDVLSASDVNGYLMQGVLVFADATERNAEITSPQEGQFAYLKDTNVTTYYTGSAWANLDTTGMTNPMTTTGDTIYSSSGSTPARLGIGSTGQVLTVAGGVPSWATPTSTTFPAFAAYKSTAQTGITATTWTKVTFDTERYDTAGNFASSRFTPTTAGYYQINALLLTADGANVTTAFYKNGSAYTRIGFAPSPSGNEWIHTAPSLIYFNGSSDYLEVYVYMSGGSARTIYGTTEVSDFSGVGIRA